MDIRSFFAPKGGAKPPDAKKKETVEVSCKLSRIRVQSIIISGQKEKASSSDFGLR